MTINENQMARYTVKVAGKKVDQKDPGGLEYICVEDHVEMIGVCELSFAAGKGTSWSSLSVGVDVEVCLGGDTRPVFVGTIASLRHGFKKGKATVTAVCMDPLVKLAASQRVHEWVKPGEEKTDSEVVNEVLGAASAPIGTVDPTKEKRKYVVQRNESDLTFIRRLAARNGFICMANSGKVDWKKPQYDGDMVDIPQNEVINLDYQMNPRGIPTEITAYGWDYVTKEKVEGTATAGDVETIGGGENAVASANVWQTPAFISDVWVNTQEGALELAKAELNRRARNYLRGRATVQGNGSLYVGGLVGFSGHAPGFNANAFVISSRHRIFVRGGFTTELIFCSNTKPS